MSQRVDQRIPTDPDLNAYNQALYLTKVTMRVCKPKDKNVNNKHVAKRNVPIANIAINYAIEIGALILEANSKYVGPRANVETKIRNYNKRIELQDQAHGLTFRLEHIIRSLHEENPFANSTLTDWIGAVVRTRDSVKAWAVADNKELKHILGQGL